MTPDKRLNQIEPVLADVVQKVDRLIEGNGQIITEVSKISGIEREVSKIPGIERTVSITAKGVGDLTINVNQRFDQLQQDVNQRFDQLQQDVNQRFDQFQQDVTDLKSGQQLILQILRDKLS